MSEISPIRISKALKELNVSIQRVVDFLKTKGVSIDPNPNTKLEVDTYNMLVQEFAPDRARKLKSEELSQAKVERVTITIETQRKTRDEVQQEQDEVLIKNIAGFEKEPEVVKARIPEKEGPTVLGKIDLESVKSSRPAKKPEEKAAEPVAKAVPPKEAKEIPSPSVAPQVDKKEIQPEPKPVVEPEMHKTRFEKLDGPTVLGKIDLPVSNRPDRKSDAATQEANDNKKKRKRITKVVPGQDFKGKPGEQRPPQRRQPVKAELTPEEIQNQVRETLAALKNKGKSTRSRYRKERRDAVSEKIQREIEQQEQESKVLKLTEYVTVSELATMMGVSPTQVIATCMSIGMMVSINQRLDSETLTMLAEEFGHTVEFVSADIEESMLEVEDEADDLSHRPPIVTVMGHVDHGKTSLLDYIRRENVIAGEAGGITQHIGAYSVVLENGKTITFLDTPGHEAFTAMRARGAQVTDIAIIVIAADDAVMPQTIEAINHAQAAGVPMIFAFNKMDKEGANPDKIREQLSAMNILVEEWGGKYQTQEISAKKGLHVNDLLEKVLLEAEMLDLKANADRNAKGTIIEASLDKGRGYTSTLLVQNGTLSVGDMLLAGSYFGRVKAMFNERGNRVEKAGPSTPVSILGLNGAPSAGDNFVVMDDEEAVKNIASKRTQLQREQSLRTQRRRTLEDIGEILQKGDYHEINLIIKGDVDGSVEALADALLKISTSNVAIRVIHKSVGQITESDVLLATASDAVIIGFQVRPSVQARKRAENEGVQIRMYSIIYDAINDMKSAMEGMLKPKIEEKVVCNIEVREVFKISKVGSVAGCYVTDGTCTRNTKVRVIRDGIVLHNGKLGSLKRFKDDVKEVKAGFECGLNIDNYNDIEVGDIIEGYEEVEVARKLEG